MRQLTLRFGALDERARTLLAGSTSEQRIGWADRAITAASLDEVFEPAVR